MTEQPWLSDLIAQRKTAMLEKNDLDPQVYALRKRVSELTAKILNLDSQIKTAKENKDKEIVLTDHAVLRYIERKYNIDIEAMRTEIMQPNVISAVKCGAKSIETNGVKFVFDKHTIVTTLLPHMNGKHNL